MSFQVKNIPLENRFVVENDHEVSSLSYALKKETMFLVHTTIKEEMKGGCIASALAEYALQYAESNNLKVAIICPLVERFVKKNPKWYKLYDLEYHHNSKQTILNASE